MTFKAAAGLSLLDRHLGDFLYAAVRDREGGSSLVAR
jgi:hypothetical protein